MNDASTPENPDTTPTESIELTEQLPAATEQPVETGAAAPAVEAPQRHHTRTILEVVGGVVAAGLIVVAGAGGFVAGLAVGDSEGGRHGGDHPGESWQGMSEGGRGFDDEGRGYSDRGYGDQGMGRGDRGFSEDGMGRGMTPDEMFEQFLDEFGQGVSPEDLPSLELTPPPDSPSQQG